MEPILQSCLPFTPWADPVLRRLPGVRPLPLPEWLMLDDAYGAQMAERERLIAERPEDVHALTPGAVPAARELLGMVLAALADLPGFSPGLGHVIRPDGRRVEIVPSAPLFTLARLVQEDFCILEQGPAGEHVLTGAILCFPASWTLAEKMRRPLAAIHGPVRDYDPAIAARVQRLFDAIRPEQPLWRANTLPYADPALHQPRRENERRVRPAGEAPYIRSERQCLLRLPESRAVVFSIHTFVVARDALSSEQAASLAARPVDQAK